MKSRNPYGRSRRFDTTADVGLSVSALTLPELFSASAWALSDMIVTIPDSEPISAVRVSLSGADREQLLFDWLNELIFLFETKHCLYYRFTVDIQENRLTADIAGFPVDLSVHSVKLSPKAVTFHRLFLKYEKSRWATRFIIDI
jgi:SHS2 domain-containing protein